MLPTYAQNFGSESYILVAPQAVWGTRVAAAELIPVAFEPTSFGFRRITEPHPTSRLKGNNSPTKNTVNMVRAEGSIDMYLHATQMGFWLRQLMHANTSEITSVQNTAQSIRAAAAYTTSVPPYTTANPRSPLVISQPVDVLTAPIECGRLNITFSGHTLGTSPRVIVNGRDQNDLRLRQEEIPVTTGTVTQADLPIQAATSYTAGSAITPTNQPEDVLPGSPGQAAGTITFTFAGATGSGSITVSGRNAAGAVVTPETVTFTNAATTPTGSTTGSFASNVSFTITGITGGTIAATVRRTAATGADVTVQTEQFYKDGVTIIVEGVTGGTIAITADPETYTHTIPLSDRVSEGFTAEIGKGDGTPSTYDSLLVSQATLTLADVLTMSFSMLAREGDLRYGIEGIRGQEYNYADATPRAHTAAFARPSIDVTANWGWAMEVDGQVYPVSDGTMLINQNIEYPQTLFWGNIHYPKPVRQNERELTIEATIDYTIDNDFDVRALGDEFVTKVSAVLKKVGGPYVSMEFNFPQSELVGFPDPEVPNLGQINQSLNIRAYTGSIGGNDEVNLRMINTESAIL